MRLPMAYLLKKSLGQLGDYETPGGALGFFEQGRASWKWQRLQPYQKFTTLVENHGKDIVAYYHTDSNAALGFVESMNNKIWSLQHPTLGLQDEEYLRRKILTSRLPKLEF